MLSKLYDISHFLQKTLEDCKLQYHYFGKMYKDMENVLTCLVVAVAAAAAVLSVAGAVVAGSVWASSGVVGRRCSQSVATCAPVA